MSCYPELDSHIRYKVKVLLDLSNYATSKKSEHAKVIDTSDLAAKKDFIALKAQVNKLEINKLSKIPTSFSYLKTKLDYWDVGKLKTVPKNLKKTKWCSG